MPYRNQSEKPNLEASKDSLLLKIISHKHTKKIVFSFIVLFLSTATSEPFVFKTGYLFLGLAFCIVLTLLLLLFYMIYEAEIFSGCFNDITTQIAYHYIKSKSIKSLLELKEEHKIYLIDKYSKLLWTEKNVIEEKIKLMRNSVE